ncbi:extracellular solute-binding protein [Streptomyces himalayensis]|uniref:Extracellular solute-binding protein n=1 Tax=Streptomyces himalayensis subsp. himalayensis TaxID=2756131 RepID=A0A7W0DU40_9ACTN|nr:extracellular solute-binding protein [Streptomyces himalayensis]MBA2951250.1 extracellular solute-binding protein [Streptomyces himalayensis subsp. himalayensis]
MRHSSRLGTATVTGTLLALLAACTGSSPAPGGDASKPLPKVTGNPPVTLDVFAPQGGEGSLRKNAFTKEIKEKFNITIRWQTTTYDANAAKEKRQISLASGDLPDAYLLIPWVDQFSQTELLKLSGQGIIQPLDQHIKQYGPNIRKAWEKEPAYKRMATAPDGHIYGMPQWNDCYHCTYSAKLWLNTTWLKKLGLEQPKTPAELRKVLRAFKNDDPNGNGKADEVPLSGTVTDSVINYLMGAYSYAPQGTTVNTNPTLVLRDGKAAVQANRDDWREGLRYIRSLYKEGLIDSGAFTQNNGALNRLGDNADAVRLGSITTQHIGQYMTVDDKNVRYKQYDAIPPLKGPDGTQYTNSYSPSFAGATFVLTSKATQTEQIQAIKMLDYLHSDKGRLDSYFGPDGWAEAKKGETGTSGKPATFRAVEAPANNEWGPLAQYNHTADYRTSQAFAKDSKSPDGYERLLHEATELYEPYAPKDLAFPYEETWIDPAKAQELATLQTNIGTFIQQSNVQFITGRKSLDADWDTYKADLEKLGLKQFLKLYQEAYDTSH